MRSSTLLCTLVFATGSGTALGQPVAFVPSPVTGSQEVPANSSLATGIACVSLDSSTGVLRWHVQWEEALLSGGVATAAHFHGPAAAGVNAGVQINIGTTTPAIGSQTLTPAQVADVVAGLWYVNVHSAGFPGGEIRGQVVPTVTDVVINEVFYDAVGGDEGATFVELSGPPGMSLAGWTVVGIEGGAASSCGAVNGGGTESISLTGTIAADGLYVLADDNGTGVTDVVVPASHSGGAADQIAPDVDFENGTDVVGLFDPTGALMDVLMYGTSSCALINPLTGDPLVECTPAFDVFGGFSLSRWPQGRDTGDNKSDFHAECDPTPGTSGEPSALFFSPQTTINATVGGSVDLNMHTARPGSGYIVFAFLNAQTSKQTLSLTFDPLTTALLPFINSPLLAAFSGTLDDCGEATATFSVPPGTVVPGTISIHFAGASLPINPGSIATNSLEISITP